MILLIELFILVACVYVLSVTVETFFVPALREIALRYEINRDIAGATLMAMGSSSPELAIALISLFIGGGGHGDIGAGTIVGSAVFNILVISGVCGLIRPVAIPRKVFSRDCVVYLVGILLLLYSFRDGTIHFFEAGLLIGAYGIYLLVLYFWNQHYSGEEEQFSTPEEPVEDPGDAGSPGLVGNVAETIKSVTGSPHTHAWKIFFASIGLIGLASYLLVNSAVIVARQTGVPEVLVGLTVLAVATSVPDLLSSVAATRSGHGGMAIANAVGSNIFDILIGLGLPWMLVILFRGEALAVATTDLWNSALVLISTVAVLYFFLFTSRKLNRLESALMILLYGAYVIAAYLGW